MKIALVLTLGMLVSGCGNIRRWWSGVTGDAQKTCVAGVAYLQFPSGATTMVDREGKPVACDE
jgi:uncharacterized protein YceK